MKTDEGVFQAKGRGIFKKQGLTLAVGDMVNIEILEDGDGIINQVLPRKNRFIRPAIANIDTFVVIFAATKPKPNFRLIDKFLIMAEMNEITPIICVNKCDLAKESQMEEIRSIYKGVYPLLEISGKTGKGIDGLMRLIEGKKVAFAGPSGVGKSTITNMMIPSANMETGAVSDKTLRGRHTTRHVEMFQTTGGGFIFDTPGFTSFDIFKAEENNLMEFYPEFSEYRGKCQFDNCRHISEPNCEIRKAVEEGNINRARYASYVANMEEIRKRKKYK